MDGACYGLDTTLLKTARNTLLFQGDGNLVLYGTSGAAVWATGTNGKNATTVCLQGDGNIVLYTSSGVAWSSKTNGSGGTLLTLQNDCNLVLYTPSSATRWATRTSCK